MKYYEQALDFVLLKIKELQSEPLASLPQIIEDWKNKTNAELVRDFKMEHWEIKTLYKELENKDYVDSSLKLSLKGVTFIYSGGYSQESENDLIERRYKNITNLLLVFGATLAGIYYTVELLKMVHKVFFG